LQQCCIIQKIRDNDQVKIKIVLVGFGILLLATVVLATTRKKPLASISSPSPSDKVVVTTSFYPLADFAAQIGKDLVTVHNLTPAGAEPHDYEPSPQDLVTLQNSKVFVYNGAGLEVWLDKLSDEVKQKVMMVNATQGVSLLTGDPEKSDSASTHPTDPHVWMDPVLASAEVENIKNGLITADPTHKEIYQQNATEYQKQLSQLDTDFREGLANCATNNIVTSHNAFQYLSKRYGVHVLSISGLSPDEEPAPKKLAEVVQFVDRHYIQYIFFESLVSPKLSETIAQETGAKTIAFNPLEGLSDEEIAKGKNYISIQRDNLAALRIALECK
jgi:zinc transport system substrate-binding protein